MEQGQTIPPITNPDGTPYKDGDALPGEGVNPEDAEQIEKLALERLASRTPSQEKPKTQTP